MKKHKLTGEQLHWHAFRAREWKRYISDKQDWLKTKDKEFKNHYLIAHQELVKEFIDHFKRIGYDGKDLYDEKP